MAASEPGSVGSGGSTGGASPMSEAREKRVLGMWCSRVWGSVCDRLFIPVDQRDRAVLNAALKNLLSRELKTQGLFRVQADAARVTELTATLAKSRLFFHKQKTDAVAARAESFDVGFDAREAYIAKLLAKEDVHTVTTLVKQYQEFLSLPPLDDAAYEKLFALVTAYQGEPSEANRDALIEYLCNSFLALKEPADLKSMGDFFLLMSTIAAKADINKMNLDNLITTPLSPTLFYNRNKAATPEQEAAYTLSEGGVRADLARFVITHYERIFASVKA